MATGYITIDGLWEEFNNVTTVISSTSDNIYSGPGASWPNDTNKVLTMAADEYPTAISFSGKCGGEINGGTLKIRLSDRYGANWHDLGSISLAARYKDAEVSSSDQYGKQIWLPHYAYDEQPMSKFDKSGPWEDLLGATLALQKVNSSYSPSLHKTTVTVVTDYIAKTVTLTHNTGGTITFDDRRSTSASMKRGSSKQIFVSADRGYKIVNVTASVGSISYVSYTDTNAIYNYTMVSPAVDATITVTFVQNIFYITKNLNIPSVGTITGPDSAIAGENVTITRPTTSTEYRFDSWAIKTNDANVAFTEKGNNATFQMPPGNVIATAKYTAHTITWSDAYLSAEHDNGWDHVRLTYRGITTDSFFDHVPTYWIYKNGIKNWVNEGGTSHGFQLEHAPNAGNQTVDVPISSGEENSDVRYSLVAECAPITSGGATASLHVGFVNRTVKYCKKNGKKIEWVECVPYFCVGPKAEEISGATNLIHYVRVSYPGTYAINIVPLQSKTYTFKNMTDDVASVILKDSENGTSNTVELNPGQTKTETIASSRRIAVFTVSGDGSVEMQCQTYPDTFNQLNANKKNISGVWVEVEPFYFHGSGGWQLCSFA